jgi:hypothetical protein
MFISMGKKTKKIQKIKLNMLFKIFYSFIISLKSKVYAILLFTVLLLFLAFIPRLYLINLRVQAKSGANLYYNVGAFVLQKEGVIDQYMTRHKEYATSYISSLYEPAFKIGEDIYTAYRPRTQQIKFRNESYFMYVSETNIILTKNVNSIPSYKTNLIVGPSIGLYGYGNSIYNYSWGEIINNFTTNTIDVDINCYDFPEARCKNRLEKLNIKAKESTIPDSFDFYYNYHYGLELSEKSKTPLASVVVPKDYYLCPRFEYSYFECLDPFERESIPWQKMPVHVYKDNTEAYEVMTLQDLNLTQFYITNLKIADRYTIKTTAPLDLQKADEYFLVHKSNNIALRFKVLNTEKTEGQILKQFGSIRFIGPSCDQKVCPINLQMQILTR